MALLKFELDTDDIGISGDYDENFESLFKESMANEITNTVVKNITKEEINQYAMTVHEKVEDNVKHLFEKLLSEDVVITDGYGRKTFVGCVEDYIKKQIDDKYLHPVDDKGKRLTGCTNSGITWVQWYITRESQKYFNEIIRKNIEKIECLIETKVRSVIDEKTDLFLSTTINNTVSEKLKNIGINI